MKVYIYNLIYNMCVFEKNLQHRSVNNPAGSVPVIDSFKHTK